MSSDPQQVPEHRTPLPLVQLEAIRGPDEPAATATIGLRVSEQQLRLEITVPSGPARLRQLLPVFQGLTNTVVAVAVENAERQGQAISCRKGCGACCRQLVPVSVSEAEALSKLVEAMPESRRSEVRRRFAEVGRRLAEAGLLDQLRQPGPAPGRELRPLGLAYFRLGLACPFLEDESCSIYADRPLACREYLVTSPAEECARPSAETVRMVPLPAQVGAAVRALDRQESSHGGGWVPLTLALEWVEGHPEEPATRPGTTLLQEFFARLTGSEEEFGAAGGHG
jgi:Fe-S-cluster containining protein